MKLKNNKMFTKTDIIMIISILIIIVTFILLKIFSSKSAPFLMQLAKNETTKIATSLINKSIYEIVYNSFDNYEEMLIINKNSDDEIISIDFNNKIANEKMYILTNNLLVNISLLEKGNADRLNLDYFDSENYIYFIPIGVIYNNPILTSIGPEIPFKVSILGNVNSSINTKVKEYGINNSLIELFINIDMNIQIILPFISEVINVNKSIPLSSKIIQGKVPTYYGGVINNTTPNNPLHSN